MSIDVKLILEYSKSLHVLYVEDDAVLSKISMKIFLQYFKDVDVALDGEKGIEKYNTYFKENGRYYDLVIADINMPIMDGIEMGRIIKAQHMEQAIIYVTAYNEAQYFRDAINIGSDGFLSKPIELEQLHRLLLPVTQRVFEHQLVTRYYNEIEDLNIQLQSKNQELELRNNELEKSLRMLNTMVEKDAVKDTNQVKEENTEDIDKNSISEQLDELEMEDIIELSHLCTDIDGSIIAILGSNADSTVLSNSLISIIESFTKFASIISYYTIFNDLSDALREFIYSIENNPLPSTNDEIINIFTLLESFIFVLKKWQENLQNKNFESVNYLDASLISDMNTIIMMYTPYEEVEGDIDFF